MNIATKMAKLKCKDRKKFMTGICSLKKQIQGAQKLDLTSRERMEDELIMDTAR